MIAMNWNYKKLFTSLLLSLLVNCTFSQHHYIIPEPKRINVFENIIYFKDTITYNIEKEIPAVSFLINYMRDKFGVIVEKSKFKADLQFIKTKSSKENLHKISINKNGVKLKYNSNEAAFHACVSLIQLVKLNSKGIQFSHANIKDFPDFEWRGLHLDCSRHFFTVNNVKQFIDIMAMYKYNRFHWHLTDDQGWRIEIKQYPKLTEIGAWRNKTVEGHYSKTPRTWNEERYGGFYTQEDIKEIVEYAQNKSIIVVPEIELPGHSMAALSAYPELGCLDTKYSVPGLWGVFDDIYSPKESTFIFLENVLDEVIELFPSKFIHIGGDEAPKTIWEKDPYCQKLIDSLTLKDEHGLQSYFIGRIEKYLNSKGRQIIGWDEILEGGLAPNAAVMSWRGESGGIQAAKERHEVVMTPTSHCYFDYYQSSHKNEPLAIGGFLPLEKVYEYSPLPEQLPRNKRKYILGAQANVWTEYMPTMDHVLRMTYPRALALIEKTWSRKGPSFNDFENKLYSYHFGFLESHDVPFSKASLDVKASVFTKEPGKLSVTFEAPDLSAKIYYTFNGDTITYNSEVNLQSSQKDSLITLKSWAIGQKGKSRMTEKSILLHQSIGLDIPFLTPPHPKFSIGGSMTLVDGVIGDRPWKGDQWLGYSGDTILIQFNFEGLKNLKRIQLGFLEDNGSWIYLPENIHLEKMINGEWTVFLNSLVNSEQNSLRLNENLDKIRVRILPSDKIDQGKPGVGHDPWTFIDEIRFEWK